MDKADVAPEAVKVHDGQSEQAEDSTSAKKQFVEPQISVPVDVLEATTFFQVTTSGSTT